MRTTPANAVSHRISATSSPASVGRPMLVSGLLSRRPRDVVAKAALLAAGLLLVLVSACTPAASEPTKGPTQSKPATSEAAKPVATSASTPAAASKPLDPVVKIKMGHSGNSTDIGVYTAIERGYFKEEGIDVELVLLPSAPEAIPVLASGELDFGAGGSAPGHFNAVARGLDLKFVADKGTVARGFSGAGLVVRKDLFDGGIKDVSGVRGKTVATNALGGSGEMYVDLALKRGGLKLEDVKLVAVSFPDILTGMTNKSIDAAWMPEPFLTIGIDKGILVRIVESNDIMPNSSPSTLTVSPVLAQKNPEAVRRVVTAHLRGQRDYYDAFMKGKTDKEPFIAILSKYTNQKDLDLVRRMNKNGVDPNGTIDTQRLVQDQDYFFQRGWVPQKVNAAALFDSQYLDYALKRLGRIE